MHGLEVPSELPGLRVRARRPSPNRDWRRGAHRRSDLGSPSSPARRRARVPRSAVMVDQTLAAPPVRCRSPRSRIQDHPRGDRVKGPAELAAARIERTHDPVRSVGADRDRRTDEPTTIRSPTTVPGDVRLNSTRLDKGLDAFPQIDVRETGAALAGARVQRDQSRIERGEKDARRARIVGTLPAMPRRRGWSTCCVPLEPVKVRIEGPELFDPAPDRARSRDWWAS